MNFNHALGAMLAMALGLTAATADAKGDRVNYSKYVFSPERGVICDTYGTAYCADGTGISMSWTGVHCKTKINACFTQKNGTEMHEAITQRIWG